MFSEKQVDDFIESLNNEELQALETKIHHKLGKSEAFLSSSNMMRKAILPAAALLTEVIDDPRASSIGLVKAQDIVFSEYEKRARMSGHRLTDSMLTSFKQVDSHD